MSKDSNVGQKQIIPLKGSSFKIPSSPEEKPCLLGKQCTRCGAIFYPKRMVCLACGNRELEDKELSPKGKIFSFLISNRAQSYCLIQPPYGLVQVLLPEGIIVEGVVTDHIEALEIDKEVELVIEKVSEDEEGNDVVGHKFRLA